MRDELCVFVHEDLTGWTEVEVAGFIPEVFAMHAGPDEAAIGVDVYLGNSQAGGRQIFLFVHTAGARVESASGGILIWRLRAERRALDQAAIERLDRRAHRLVGISLFLLAAFVAFESVRTLAIAERPDPTLVGIVLTSGSIAVMMWLARAKRRAAKALGSRALEADAFQTTACWWLSVLSLSGMGLNAALGWWWADPVAALIMVPIIVKEGIEALRGETCCDEGACH